MPISSFASQADMIVSAATPSALPSFMPPPNQIAQVAQLPPPVAQQQVALTVSASNPQALRAATPDTPLVLTNQTSINDMRQNHVAEILPMLQIQQVTNSTGIEG